MSNTATTAINAVTYQPTKGRPPTSSAKIFTKGPAKQLWLSKGALALLDFPGRVSVSLSADGEVLFITEVDEGAGLRVSAQGYVSASGFIRALGVTPANRYDAELVEDGKIKLTPIAT